MNPVRKGRIWLWALVGGLFGLIGALYYSGRHPGSRDIFELAYGFGSLIESLRSGGGYGVEHSDHPTYGPISFHAHRLPLLPWLGAAASLLGRDVVWLYLLKNLLAFGAIGWAVGLVWLRASNPKWFALLPFALYLLLPGNAAVAFAVDFEEGYPLSLVALALAGILYGRGRRSALCVGACLVGLVLLKSSLMLVAGGLAGLALALFWREGRLSAMIPIVAVCLAVLGWGLFALQTSGRFAFGASASSWNGPNFYKANNEHAPELYPLRHLDILEERGLMRLKKRFADEWDVNDAYMAAGWKFRSEHPGEVARMNRAKLETMFLHVRPAFFFEEPPAERRIDPKLVVAMILQWVSLFIAGWALLARRSFTPTGRCAAAAVPLLYLLYLPPYWLGFVYDRHLVPLVGATCFLAGVVLVERASAAQQQDR